MNTRSRRVLIGVVLVLAALVAAEALRAGGIGEIHEKVRTTPLPAGTDDTEDRHRKDMP